MGPLECPNCSKIVVPIVRDNRGHICPVCEYEFDANPPTP